jgi:hypothetical protein
MNGKLLGLFLATHAASLVASQVEEMASYGTFARLTLDGILVGQRGVITGVNDKVLIAEGCSHLLLAL